MSGNIQLKSDGLYINNLIEGYTLHNIVPHGSFENLDGWINVEQDFSEYLYGECSSKLSATEGMIINFYENTPIQPKLNHVYYGRHSIKTNGENLPADCRFEWFAGDGEGLNWAFGENQGNYPEWHTSSNVHKIEVINGSNYNIRNFVVASTADCWCDGLMIIDLTESFGKGNEPSKEWCDEVIPFFEDSYFIPVNQKIYMDNGVIYCSNFDENNDKILSIGSEYISVNKLIERG